MKKTLLFVLTAFFMLFGTSAMAQVDSTLKGDVNEDGIVDVADIAAVIQIMKEAQGTQYYWYVGQENPASMTKIDEKDIESRKRIYDNFAQVVAETFPDGFPIVFHGTNNIGTVRQILKTGGFDQK